MNILISEDTARGLLKALHSAAFYTPDGSGLSTWLHSLRRQVEDAMREAGVPGYPKF